PVYQGSDVIELHLSDAAQGYVQMRQRDTGQWVDVLGSPVAPVAFVPGWNRQRFSGNRLYFGREYRLVLLTNVRVNELRFERVTVADLILAGRIRLTGDMAMVAQDGQTEKVAVGDISGRMWRGQPLPPGTHGLWAPDGFIAVSMHETYHVYDFIGTSTSSRTFVDIPGFSLTFFLDREAECLLYMNLWTNVYSVGSNALGLYQMVLDGSIMVETERLFGIDVGNAESGVACSGAVTALTKRVLSPGQHTLKGQFAADTDSITTALTRTIGVLALTR